MSFIEAAAREVGGRFWNVALWTVLPLVPFIIAEQLRPVGPRPGWRDYGLNILVNLSTSLLMMPVGMGAGALSHKLHGFLPWRPLSVRFDSLGHVPLVGPPLEVLAMIFVPVVLHDLWFYWAHRLEHRVPFLWELHKLHHSDDRMNCSSFARDQFLQAAFTAFFPILTLGLFLDLDLKEAGRAAFYSNVFFVALTMFCHSAIRVRLPWLDRLLVTPQVHRLHHSRDPRHFNTNFADALPIFDILFGTYRRPAPDEFPPTGLPDAAAPRSLWKAQGEPLRAIARGLGREV